jgi:dextranase
VPTSNHKLAEEGEDAIWVVPKRIGDDDVLHLINLVSLDDLWRNKAETPPVQTNVGLRYYTEDSIEAVYLASPDFNFGQSASLRHTAGEDERGRYIEFTVPQLSFWDMVYIRRAD